MKTMNNKVAKIDIDEQLNLKIKLRQKEERQIMDTEGNLIVDI